MDEKRRERDRRLEIFNTIMEERNLDGLIFTSIDQQTCQMAVKYATNYTLVTRRDFACMAKGKMPILMLPTVGHVSAALDVCWLPPENIVGDNMMERVKDFVAGLGKDHPRIGLYEPEQLPISVHRELIATGAEFEDITQRLTELRAPKSEYEMERIREASRIAVRSFEWVVKHLRPGVTEREIIGGVEGYLRVEGAEETLVLTRTRKPHTFIARALDIPIQEDGVFVYSCEMAGPGGYWTQVVRPVFMRRGCQPEAYEVLQVIKEALAAGEAALKPGNRICDVDAAIAEVVKKRGCHAGVWSGHGMGADLGDGIDIGMPNKMELKPNMVLTLHPSVMNQNRSDGLLYGNTYAVTESGFVNLTDGYADSCYLEDLLTEMETSGGCV